MKKVLVLLMALVMLLVFVACAAPAEAPKNEGADGNTAVVDNSDQVYYMVTFLATIEFWDECFVGFEDAASMFGVTTKYMGCEEQDVSAQKNILDQVIATNPTGITVTCADSTGLIDSINAAMEKGIEVVCFDSDAPDSNRYSITQTGNAAAGKDLAKAVCEELGGEGKVALIYQAGLPTGEARAEGIRAGIAEYPGVEIVAEAGFNGEQDDGAAQSASVISANPELDAILLTNANGTLGTVTSAREANKAGEILIAGFDHDAGIFDAIEAGEVFATAKQGAYNMGFWSFLQLYVVANDITNPVEGWRENGLNPLPTSIDSGCNIVTKDNVAAFMN